MAGKYVNPADFMNRRYAAVRFTNSENSGTFWEISPKPISPTECDKYIQDQMNTLHAIHNHFIQSKTITKTEAWGRWFTNLIPGIHETYHFMNPIPFDE